MDSDLDATNLSKICAMILFSVCSVLIGLLPLFINIIYKRKKGVQHIEVGKKSKYKILLSQLAAFGGGVLLSTAFLHLLPEIRESINTLQEKGVLLKTRPLPLAEFLMCLGFLLLYLVEEVAHNIVLAKHCTSEPECVAEFVNYVYATPRESAMTQKNSSTDPEQNIVENEPTQSVEKCTISDGKAGNRSHLGRSCRHHEDKTDRVVFKKGCSKNYLLIFALSIHEAFEGLAIGLETEPEAVWYMILGVGAHKAVIAFCIGVQLVTAQINHKIAILCILVFASATSIGVAIGLFLYSENGIVAIILQGLATGTLIHVVFFELLKPHTHSTPFCGVFVGFISMAILKYFTPS